MFYLGHYIFFKNTCVWRIQHQWRCLLIPQLKVLVFFLIVAICHWMCSWPLMGRWHQEPNACATSQWAKWLQAPMPCALIGVKWYACRGDLSRRNKPNAPRRRTTNRHTGTHRHTLAFLITSKRAPWCFAPCDSAGDQS